MSFNLRKLRPITLIVLDGVGYNENPKGNAVISAKTPNFDLYRKKYPHCLLDASGESVGLPPGFQGSSEAGHLSMGAGRIIKQELLRINDKLIDVPIYNHNSLTGRVSISNGHNFLTMKNKSSSNPPGVKDHFSASVLINYKWRSFFFLFLHTMVQ